MRAVAKGQFNAVLKFSEQVDEERLRQAVDQSLSIEHVLACRLVEHWFRPYWTELDGPQRQKSFQLMPANNPEQQIQEFLFSTINPQTGPQVRVVLLRDETDTLLVKLNHLSGDGTAFKNYVQWLIRLYNRGKGDFDSDRGDPLTPYAGYDRSLTGIVDRLPLSHQFRIVRRFLKNSSTPLSWRLADNQTGGSGRCYMVAALSAEQTDCLLEYGRHHQAPLTVLLQAAIYVSSQRIAEPTSDQVKLGFTADLRWFLQDQKRHPGTGCTTPMANLSGPSKSVLDARREFTFHEAVEQLRRQFDEIKSQELIGVEYAPLLMAFTGVRWLTSLLPYALMKRSFNRRFRQLRKSRCRHFSIANLGDWEADELTPSGVDIVEMLVTGPIYELLGMAVFSYLFGDRLHIQLGFAETLLDRETGERYLDTLVSELVRSSQGDIRAPRMRKTWVA